MLLFARHSSTISARLCYQYSLRCFYSTSGQGLGRGVGRIYSKKGSPLGGYYSIVKRFFNRHPFLANSLSMGCLCSAAEFTQQILNHYFKEWQNGNFKLKSVEKPEHSFSFDWTAVKNYGILGSCILSPIMRVWYRWLDKRFVGSTFRIVFPKLLIDEFLFGPVSLLIFFLSMSLLEGKEDISAEARKKFIPTFVMDCLFWLPTQMINFLFISPTFRILFLGACSFFWLNILCVVRNIENYMDNSESGQNNGY